ALDRKSLQDQRAVHQELAATDGKTIADLKAYLKDPSRLDLAPSGHPRSDPRDPSKMVNGAQYNALMLEAETKRSAELDARLAAAQKTVQERFDAADPGLRR